MKMKKILAAIAACAMSAAMVSMTAFAAPDEGNRDEIPDEPEIEEPVEPDEPEVPAEPEPEPEPEPKPEPVAVNNPTTGNAPIALAVIPVALAAAAVVAKKAK